ncbi:MAG: CHAP domain-containing protein [Lachnospiraceae bacterium]|nr:CHAP domain-containing protein [Lachnospiraceae bacterium]
MKKILKCMFLLIFVVTVTFIQKIPGTDINWGMVSQAADYSNNGCVQWVKDRASQIGITLPSSTGTNEYGLFGASAYWTTLSSYPHGSEPAPNSLAVWKFNNGSDGAGGKYGHVAYVESVNGDNVTVTEGGCKGYSYAGNTGVICRTQSKSKMATLGNCSGFYGYIYLTGQPSNDPKGYVDDCASYEMNKLTVRGWAYDADNMSQQIDIHVYIGSETDATAYKVTANTYRSDVDDAYHCGGYHGFESIITTNRTGNQRVRIYAINVGGGNNICLYDNTVYIKGDTEKPQFIQGKVSDLNEKGYKVECTWGDNVGVTDVKFAIKEKGESNFTWYDATTKDPGTRGTWTFVFSNGEKGKSYITEIYAYDKAGNSRHYALADYIKLENDTEAPTYKKIDIRQRDDGKLVLHVEISDNNNLGMIDNYMPFFYFSSDKNSGRILHFISGTEVNHDIYDAEVTSIVKNEFVGEDIYDLKCNAIVGFNMDTVDLAGNHAIVDIDSDSDILTMKSGHLKGRDKGYSAEVTLKTGDQVTISSIWNQLKDTCGNMDAWKVYVDEKNERILKKTSTQSEIVLEGNEPGIEYVYFTCPSSNKIASCKITVENQDEKGELSKITAAKTNTTYYVGDNINVDDLTINAVYNDGSEKLLNSTEYSTNIKDLQTINAGTFKLIVTYVEGEKTKTADIIITVKEKNEKGDDKLMVPALPSDNNKPSKDNSSNAGTNTTTANKQNTVNRPKAQVAKISGVTVRTSTDGTVKVIKLPSGKKKITIPTAVEIEDVKYMIVSIGKKAFKGIKRNAVISINTKQPVNIEKNAFKGINSKKVVIKVNKKMKNSNLKRFKKILKKAGFKGKVKKVLK